MTRCLRSVGCILLAALVFLSVIACSSSGPDGPLSTTEVQVAGLIAEMEVQGDKLLKITVRESSSDTKTFPIRDPSNLGVDVAHLREHQDTKLKVTLILSQDRGRLVVDRIED